MKHEMRMWIGKFANRIACVVVSLGMASCGSHDDSSKAAVTETPPGDPVELMSYWTSPGDAEALQALLDVHQDRHPDLEIFHAPGSAMAISSELALRIADGNPPDVVTLHGAELSFLFETSGPGSLHPLDAFLDSPSRADVLENLYPELVSNATIDGNVYGLPVALVRVNLFFYNRHVFTAHGLSPATTLDEFRSVCQTLKAAGITPITVPIPSLLFEDLLPAVMGAANYHSYRTGGAPDEAALRDGIDVLEEVLDNYVSENSLVPSPTGYEQDIEAFMDGRIAMFVAGDWSEGMFQQLGWTPGVDFGMISPPGNAGLVAYLVDMLSILGNTPELEGALDFLDTAASMDGQTAFQRFKNGIPARKDVDVSSFSPERQTLIEEMKRAEYRFAPMMDVWAPAVRAFIASTPHDKEALLQAMLTSH